MEQADLRLNACRMVSHRTVLLAILLLSAFSAGCKSDPYMDAYFDTVNAEKRALEDAIYDLKYENEKLRKELKSPGERTNATPTSAPPRTTDSDDEPFDGGYGPFVEPPSNPGTEDPVGPSSSPDADPPENPDLSVPMTEPGVETDPEEIFPDLKRTDATQAEVEVQSPQTSVAQGSGTLEIADSAAEVTHLHINRVATRGRNTDGQPGDDMLVIGLEPRDQYGRFVAAASTVQIVLLDPDLKGQAARVGQWQFDPATVAEGAQHAGSSPMIMLEAVWPKRPPTNSRLHLWARYITTDGRILQTKETVHITPAGDLSARWTPRTGSPSARVAEQPGDVPEWKPNR